MDTLLEDRVDGYSRGGPRGWTQSRTVWMDSLGGPCGWTQSLMIGFYDCSYDRTKEVFLFLFKSRVVRINESAGLKRFLSLCRRWFCCCFPLACGPSCAAVEDPVTSLPKRQHGVKATGHRRATRAPGFSRSAPRMLAEDIFRNSRSVATPRHGPAGRKEKHVVTIVMGDLTPLHPHCPRADMTHTTWMEFPPRLWISLNSAGQVADSFFFDNSAVGGRGWDGGGLATVRVVLLFGSLTCLRQVLGSRCLG